MERNKQKHALVNLLALLAVSLGGLATARYANSLAGQVASFFAGLGALVAAVSWFQMRLEDNERLEKLEFDELAKSHVGSALFEAKDSEVFPAQRSREQFERLFVPIFTVFLCLAQAGGAYLMWRWLSRPTTVPEVKYPITGLASFGLFAFVLFLLGRFSSTIARLQNQRLLRPGAGQVLFSAVLCFLVALGIIAVWTGYPRTDSFIAYGLSGLLAVISLENLINLILEIYRPRVKGKAERPLYESRLAGLLGQPEGLVTTAAQALDYQFGFKVSETWFYRLFFERALKWLILAQLALLALSTCVVFIEAGEQGLLERFGKPAGGRTLLQPGGHLKWPWPIDRVYRYRTDQIQSFEVGVKPGMEVEEKKEAPAKDIILWTAQHAGEQEDYFLVAGRQQSLSDGPNGRTGKELPPVSLVTGSIPVQYQITDLVQWAYKNHNPKELLESLARRDVLRYFLNADMNELMSSARLEASEQLRHRVQAEADARQLGVRIISVGMQDMHPPVKVGADYELVVAAIAEKNTRILDAKTGAIQTNAQAAIEATRLLTRAMEYQAQKTLGALGEVALFTNQLVAFRAAPSVYPEQKYFATLVETLANTPKCINLTTNNQNVFIFDLQTSLENAMERMRVAPKTDSK